MAGKLQQVKKPKKRGKQEGKGEGEREGRGGRQAGRHANSSALGSVLPPVRKKCNISRKGLQVLGAVIYGDLLPAPL